MIHILFESSLGKIYLATFHHFRTYVTDVRGRKPKFKGLGKREFLKCETLRIKDQVKWEFLKHEISRNVYV